MPAPMVPSDLWVLILHLLPMRYGLRSAGDIGRNGTLSLLRRILARFEDGEVGTYKTSAQKTLLAGIT